MNSRGENCRIYTDAASGEPWRAAEASKAAKADFVFF
jgi:hypothetical protein